MITEISLPGQAVSQKSRFIGEKRWLLEFVDAPRPVGGYDAAHVASHPRGGRMSVLPTDGTSKAGWRSCGHALHGGRQQSRSTTKLNAGFGTSMGMDPRNPHALLVSCDCW